MKFYLIKAGQIVLTLNNEETVNDNASLKGSMPTGLQQIQTDIIPFDINPGEIKKCHKLKGMLQEFSDQKMGTTSSCALYRKTQIWDMDLQMGVCKTPGDDTHYMQGCLQLVPRFHGNCLEGLRELSDHEARVKVDMIINQLGSKQVDYLFSTKEMIINPDKGAQCHDYTLKFPIYTFANWWEDGSGVLNANLSVRVTVPDDILTGYYKSKCGDSASASCRLNQKILEEQILSDVTLIPECGTEIKAHKVFLAGHSSVFLTMFQTDMSESKESVVEIPDMCEDSVRALLKYCYYEDINAAEESSIVCFALYIAAHKYDIGPLEAKTKEILLRKKSSLLLGWWDVDVAVKLFHFSRKMAQGDEELEMKAVQVLKTCTGNLADSSSYLELFEKDPKAAMELCQYALTMHTRLSNSI